MQQVKHTRDMNDFLFCIKRDRDTAEASREETAKRGEAADSERLSVSAFYNITAIVVQVWTEDRSGSIWSPEPTRVHKHTGTTQKLHFLH